MIHTILISCPPASTFQYLHSLVHCGKWCGHPRRVIIGDINPTNCAQGAALHYYTQQTPPFAILGDRGAWDTRPGEGGVNIEHPAPDTGI